MQNTPVQKARRGLKPSRTVPEERSGTVREGRVVACPDRELPFIDAHPPVDLPGALPGEWVSYRVVGKGAHRARGALQEVLDPHPARVHPVCARWEACGSCDRMHLDLPAQQAEKQERLHAILEPFLKPGAHGLAPVLEPLVASPEALGYRRRARFTFAGRPGALRLGAWAAGSHRVVELGECPVTDNHLLQARDRLRVALEQVGLPPYDERTGAGILRHLHLQVQPETGAVLALLVITARSEFPWSTWASALLELEQRRGRSRLVGLALNLHPEPGNALLGPETFPLAGEGWLELSIGGMAVQYPAGAFSQVNLPAAGLLYQEAARWVSEMPTREGGGLIELYCGVGGLGQHLLRALPTLAWGWGNEQVAGAVDAAWANAARLAPGRWTYTDGDAELGLRTATLPGPVCLAAVNPPRRGLGAGMLDALVARAPSRILYVSCQPETLVRDLHGLQDRGYSLLRARAFDFFPQTHHLETLAWVGPSSGLGSADAASCAG